jgi:hypothetical protein
MTQLWELASLIRSKNAGPWEVTFDVMFDDVDAYRRVLASGVLTADRIAEIYGVAAGTIHLVNYDAALAIKATMPRTTPAGGLGERDLVGCQQYAPLTQLEIPEAPSA